MFVKEIEELQEMIFEESQSFDDDHISTLAKVHELESELKEILLEVKAI